MACLVQFVGLHRHYFVPTNMFHYHKRGIDWGKYYSLY